MSQPSLVNYIVKRPWLRNMMKPLANWYANAAGYRKLGLRYDCWKIREALSTQLASAKYMEREKDFAKRFSCSEPMT
jgi:ubiquinol-cytochrome c reductase subunit 7